MGPCSSLTDNDLLCLVVYPCSLLIILYPGVTIPSTILPKEWFLGGRSGDLSARKVRQGATEGWLGKRVLLVVRTRPWVQLVLFTFSGAHSWWKRQVSPVLDYPSYTRSFSAEFGGTDNRGASVSCPHSDEQLNSSRDDGGVIRLSRSLRVKLISRSLARNNSSV